MLRSACYCLVYFLSVYIVFIYSCPMSFSGHSKCLVSSFYVSERHKMARFFCSKLHSTQLNCCSSSSSVLSYFSFYNWLTQNVVPFHCTASYCKITFDVISNGKFKTFNTGAHINWFYQKPVKKYRVSQKKLWFVENGQWGPLGWARVKNRTIFEKFRKFSIW